MAASPTAARSYPQRVESDPSARASREWAIRSGTRSGTVDDDRIEAQADAFVLDG